MKLKHYPGAALALAALCTATSALAQTARGSEPSSSLQGSWSASDLIGTRVRSADGREIGEIEDLVVADARIVTAVISVGGLFDIADKLVAVPYDDLRVSGDNETLAVPLTKAEIEAAPSYTGRPPVVGHSEPLVDPALTAPPDAATRREAEEEAERSFSGDDPRVADGIAENKKAYEDAEDKPADSPRAE